MAITTQYQILFTDRFEKDLNSGWPQWLYTKLYDSVMAIAKDPFTPRSGIRKLTGSKDQYRIRAGKWRLRYSLETGKKELLVERLALRGEAYSKGQSTARGAVADEERTREILDRLRGEQSAVQKTESKSIETPPSEEGRHESEETAQNTLRAANPELVLADDLEAALEPSIDVEAHPLVSSAELLADMLDDPKIDWLLEQHNVNQDTKNAIYDCESDADFEAISLPESLRGGLEELMTGNESEGSDFERIYRLEDSDFGTLAARPLKSFLLHLDKAQQEMVDKPLDRGPYLIRGAAGTGKTLVCLYRLRRMLIERTHQSLLDTGRQRYAFMSFTNSLVLAAQNLYDSIVHDLDLNDVTVEFLTIESQIGRLRKEHERTGHPPIPPSFRTSDQLGPNEILDTIISEHPNRLKIHENWSLGFLIDEFDQILYGNALDSFEEYRPFKRKGRDTKLGTLQKKIIWELFEQFHARCLQEGKLTFDGVRREVLRRMDAGELSTQQTYAYLFVDEVQDVPPTVLRILRKIVSAKERLTLASDSGQSIFRRAPSWASVHKDLKFSKATSLELQKSYRMSKQIQNAIAPLRVQQSTDKTKEPTTKAVLSGTSPALIWSPPDRMAKTTVNLVQRIHTEIGAPYGSIAIALRTNPKKGDSIIAALTGAKIPFTVYRSADRNLDLDSDKVHIITAHSIKGLEFPHVIIPEVSGRTYPLAFLTRTARSEREKEEVIEKDRRLLYVACSRAMHTLWLLADKDYQSPFIKQLDHSLWEVVEIQS